MVAEVPEGKRIRRTTAAKRPQRDEPETRLNDELPGDIALSLPRDQLGLLRDMKKTLVVRVMEEKLKQVKVGTKIRFFVPNTTSSPDAVQLARVTAVAQYSSFRALFAEEDVTKALGPGRSSKDNAVKHFKKFFSQKEDDIAKNGVVSFALEPLAYDLRSSIVKND